MSQTIFISCSPGSEPSSRAFYGDVLGLAEVARPSSLALRPGCWFEGEDFRLNVTPEEFHGAGDGARQVSISLDLAKLAERLTESGFPVTWNEDGLPAEEFHTRDPYGNVLVFARRDSGTTLTCQRGRSR